MSSTKKLIENAIKNAEITDYIMLIREECMTVILVEDFIKDIVFGGELICDTLLGCWKTMGQFDGGTNPDNGDEDECDCDPDFVKIHFPKGEGIKIIDEEGKATVPDSIYPIKVGENQFQLVIVDEEGNKRNLAPLNQIELISSDNTVNIEVTEDGETDLTVDFPVVDGKSSSDLGVSIYDGLDTDKKIKILPLISDTIKFEKKIEDGKSVLRGEIIQGADENIKQFYVNENYPFVGNGSISKPYQKYTNALKAVIGTGTTVNPQYKNAEVKLQSNVTVTQADLDAVPILENKLSVNTTLITSENNFTINFSGNPTYDYPFSTQYLKDKALANSYEGRVYLNLENITIYSETVKGIINLETYQDSNILVGANLNNVTINGLFRPDLYTQLYDGGSPITLFGNPVKGQTTAIANTTPTVYFHGFNNNNLGELNIKGYLKIIGSSQTFLKIQNTAVATELIDVEHNPFYLSVDNTTSKNPKSGIYRIEIYNAWLKCQELRSDEEMSGYGGNDSFIRYYDDGSYPGANFIIDSGIVYNARFNKILSVNSSSERGFLLNNCDFRKVMSLSTLGSLVNENGASITRNVNIEGSYFKDLKQSSVSGITVNAAQASVNGAPYSDLSYYASNSDALTAGLLPGCYYKNSTGQIIQVQ